MKHVHESGVLCMCVCVCVCVLCVCVCVCVCEYYVHANCYSCTCTCIQHVMYPPIHNSVTLLHEHGNQNHARSVSIASHSTDLITDTFHLPFFFFFFFCRLRQFCFKTVRHKSFETVALFVVLLGCGSLMLELPLPLCADRMCTTGLCAIQVRVHRYATHADQ